MMYAKNIYDSYILKHRTITTATRLHCFAVSEIRLPYWLVNTERGRDKGKKNICLILCKYSMGNEK